MKQIRLYGVLIIVLLSLTSVLVFAQFEPPNQAVPPEALATATLQVQFEPPNQAVPPEAIAYPSLPRNRENALVLTQDVPARQEPVSSFAPPAEALMPCPMEVTAATVCDVIATQREDIVGVWSLYFQSQPAFIRFNLDGTWVLGNSLESTSDLASAYASGPYSFDDEGVFTSVFTGAPLDVVPEECQAGRYILRVLKVGGQPVALNHMVIEDCFVNRETDWAYAMLWVSAE